MTSQSNLIQESISDYEAELLKRHQPVYQTLAHLGNVTLQDRPNIKLNHHDHLIDKQVTEGILFDDKYIENHILKSNLKFSDIYLSSDELIARRNVQLKKYKATKAALRNDSLMTQNTNVASKIQERNVVSSIKSMIPKHDIFSGRFESNTLNLIPTVGGIHFLVDSFGTIEGTQLLSKDEMWKQRPSSASSSLASQNEHNISQDNKPSKRANSYVSEYLPIHSFYSDDRLVLQEMYRQMMQNGKWLRDYGWCDSNLNINIKEYFGCKTNADNCVININLSKNNIVGLFPEILDQLPHLRSLVLDDNKLYGVLPGQSLFHMKNLFTLSLRNNNLCGDIPWLSLALMPHLKELWLCDNKFTGIIVGEAIEAMTKLQYLSIRNNKLHGVIPVEIQALKELELLSVSGNSFEGSIPSAIHSLRKLRYVYLDNNKFTGKVPLWIKDFEFLVDANVNGNHLSDT